MIAWKEDLYNNIGVKDFLSGNITHRNSMGLYTSKTAIQKS